MKTQIEAAKAKILVRYEIKRSAGERAALQAAECQARGISQNGPDTAAYDRLDDAAKIVTLIEDHEAGVQPVIRGNSRESVLAADARQAGETVDAYLAALRVRVRDSVSG